MTSLRRDLEQAVLQVTSGVLGAAVASSTRFPPEKRHFDRIRHSSVSLVSAGGRGSSSVLLVDRAGALSAAADVVDVVVSAVRPQHHAPRPHRYLPTACTNVIRLMTVQGAWCARLRLRRVETLTIKRDQVGRDKRETFEVLQ